MLISLISSKVSYFIASMAYHLSHRYPETGRVKILLLHFLVVFWLEEVVRDVRSGKII